MHHLGVQQLKHTLGMTQKGSKHGGDPLTHLCTICVTTCHNGCAECVTMCHNACAESDGGLKGSNTENPVKPCMDGCMEGYRSNPFLTHIGSAGHLGIP